MGHGGASHRADQRLVLSLLEKDLSEQLARGLPGPDALLVTGDIASSGDSAQYSAAKDWLLRVAKKMQLDERSIFTVPGNHDVQRAVDKDRSIARIVRALREGAEELDDVLFNDEERTQLARRMADYLAFAAQFAPAPAYLSARDGFSLASWSYRRETKGGLRVRLVGLNTALLAANDEDRGRLRLGKRAIESALETLPEDNELVLLLSHHPLRDGWLHDGHDVDSWFRGRAHVHLFGHVHEPDLEQSRAGSARELIRIVAGAVHGKRKPAGMPAGHGYSLAAVYPRKEGGALLRVWPRLWSDKAKDFLADIHNLPKERECAEHVIAGIRLPSSP